MPANEQSIPRHVPQPGRSTLTPDYQRDWTEYYTAVAGKPPRDTLLKAADLFDRDLGPGELRTGIDIGCGSGRDSHELLRRGWHVWATDLHDDSRRLTLDRAPRDAADRLVYVAVPMEEIPANTQLPPVVDLINASFALPFCRPECFPTLWRWVEKTVRPHGRFAGQFFGDRDEWACVRPKSHFARAQVEEIFRNWTIEHFEEVEKEGDDATGKPKYHHVFHVVARKAGRPDAVAGD